MKQIPDDDVMANESVKMVQRQGFLIHKKTVLGVGSGVNPQPQIQAASDCWILGKIWNLLHHLGPFKFRCYKM